MYLPEHFAERRVDVLQEAIRNLKFGTLVTFGSSGIEANSVPMLIAPDPPPFGTLRGHLARANKQWERADTAIEALAIFLGPQTYVTPAWYPAKREHGKVVPTWNYVAIQAAGTIRFLRDPEELRAHVTALTNEHERTREDAWEVTDAPPDYIDGMLKNIVGFELRIARLEGKWKASQNRSDADRESVREHLIAAGLPSILGNAEQKE